MHDTVHFMDQTTLKYNIHTTLYQRWIVIQRQYNDVCPVGTDHADPINSEKYVWYASNI